MIRTNANCRAHVCAGALPAKVALNGRRTHIVPNPDWGPLALFRQDKFPSGRNKGEFSTEQGRSIAAIRN